MDEFKSGSLITHATPGQIVETLGVVLVTCAYPILSHGLAAPPGIGQFHLEAFIARTLSDLGWALLVCSLLSKDGQFNWNLPKTKRGWIVEVAWGCLLYPVMIYASKWTGWVAVRLGFESGPTGWTTALADPRALMVFRILGPISALYQELLFRVYLQARLSAILGRWAVFSIPIAAWLFAEVHGYPPAQTASMFAVGMALGVVYQWTGRIPRLVVAHALNLSLRLRL